VLFLILEKTRFICHESIMKIWLILIFLYIISPVDFFPDYMGPLTGYIDDALLLLLFSLFKGKPLLKRMVHALFANRKQQRTFQSNRREQRREQTEQTSQAGQKTSEVKTPWEILGVPRSASQKEIKEAYRKKSMEYHPDRVAHLGPELKKVADEEFRKIKHAYDLLVR